MNVQPLQPWAKAWDRRMKVREEAAPPTEREQTLANYLDFLSSAPIRQVEGLEEEVGQIGDLRIVARLSCGHLQSVWREGGIRCLGCYHEILAVRENWISP